VRTKIMGIVLGLVALLGLGTTFWVSLMLEHVLRDQLEMRGASVTRDLAARATDLILTNNIFALHNLVHDTVQNNEDLLYAFVVDDRGQVAVHTFQTGMPRALLQANSAGPADRYHLELLSTEKGLVWDFAVPILDGKAGTARVGISERHLQAAVTAATQQLLFATGLAFVLAVVAAYALTWLLTRPVLQLVQVTLAVGRGDMTQRAPIWADDEIGRLGAAFNEMVRDLAGERDRSQAFSNQLLRRNRELAALHTIATTMSGPTALNDMLDRALQAVLKATGFAAGWVVLFDALGQIRAPVCWAGLSPDIAAREGRPPSPCPCRQAVVARRPLVVALDQACPALGAPLRGGGRIACHASVPLMAGDRALGILHIASEEPGSFGADDLDLLGAVGRELGVAVENARLWEEVRRKEELRGELLAKVITAQEEERRRIARELHDEMGQALTSLMVGLKVAAESENPQTHLAELRQIAANTLAGVRDLARDLRPSLLDDLGLLAALERYVAAYGAKFGVETDFQAAGFSGDQRLPPQVEVTLYRIIQEALTNVAKHAHAHEVCVVVERKPGSVVALVEDDGTGFVVGSYPASSLGVDQPGLGLYGMQERAALLGGTLTVESSPGQGATVRVEIPLE